MSTTTTTFTITSGYTNVTQSDGGGGTTTDKFSRAYSQNLTTGTAAGQVNVAYRDYQSGLASSSSVTYVLSALPNGQSMTQVRQFSLEVASPLGSGISGTLGPAVTHGWTNGFPGNVTIGPVSYRSFSEPDVTAPVVTSGSNDSFTIAATVGPLAYYLQISGIN